MKKIQRLIAFVVSTSIVLGTMPYSVFAQEACGHHVSHTSECGYQEVIAGTPCLHEHSVDCYVEMADCIHEHHIDCYADGILPLDHEAKEASACTHECSEESGCIKKELNCQHEHDNICGYSVGSKGYPCEFICEECTFDNNEELKDEITNLFKVQLMNDFTSSNQEEKKTFNGHTYQFIKQDISWANAGKYCEEQGGHLLTITSKEEQDFITDYLYSIYQESNSRGGSWLALIYENGEARWTTGEDFDYSNWRPGEPNAKENEIGYGIVNRNGFWNDGGSVWSDGEGFICEWDNSSTGSDDIIDIIGEVGFLSRYDSATRNIVFGNDEVSPYILDESVDTSNINQLINKYVLVTMDDDSILTVNSIEPVESYIGTVSLEGDHSLTIDGVNYPVQKDVVLGIYDGQEILYHVCNGIIVGLNVIKEKTGTLERWDGAENKVTINGTDYPTNYLTDLSFLANIDQILGTQVGYYVPEYVSYQPVLKINFYETIVGTFSHYDVFDNVAYIDGERYPVDSVVCNPDTNALNGKRVFFLLKGGKMIHIDTMDKISAKYGIHSSVTSLGGTTYRDGEFSKKYFPVKVEIYYKVNCELPAGYDEKKLLSESGLGLLVLESMTWSNEIEFKFTGSDINGIKVEPGKSVQLEFTVSMADGYVPKESGTISGMLSISGKDEKSDQPVNMQRTFSVGITKIGQGTTDPDNPGNPEDGKELSQWQKGFLHQLYEIEDVDVNIENGQYSLARYFNKETIEDIGRLVTYWTAVLSSDHAKYTIKGNAYLKLNCIMTENSYAGHCATLIFKYNPGLNWSFAKFNTTKFILIDETTGATLVDDGIHSFSVSASAKKFTDGIDSYLKAKYGEEWKDFCKKLGTQAIKDMVSDAATITGEQYLNTMLDIYKDIETIANNAKQFAGYTEKASSILRNPIEASVSSAKEFNSITSKYISAKCPVNMYVYNSQGKLCGAIENDVIILDTIETFMDVSNGEKSAWVNDDCTIKLVATDIGTMDYTIKEYKEGKEYRTVFFDDVPLSNGIIYNGGIPKQLNVLSSAYALTDNNGKKVYADSDTMKEGTTSGSGGRGSKISKYTIKALSAENGKIELKPKDASKGTIITITVIPDNGYELKTLIVTDKKGDLVDLTEKEDGQYTFIMPSSNVTVEGSFEKIKADKEHTAELFNPFIDINMSDWFYDAVLKIYANKVMNGVSENEFAPQSPTTRGMIVTILHNMENRPAPQRIAPFLDVTSDKYYADAVAWASENNIVSGYDTQTFGPNDPITREQLASILWRYAKYKGYDVSVGQDTNILSYTDTFNISEYAIPAMQWTCGAGIMSGNDDGTLNPSGFAKRAEVASILVRFCNNI